MKQILLTIVLFLILTTNCDQFKKAEASTPVEEEKPPVAVNAVRAGRGLVPRLIGVSGVASGIQEVTVSAETMGKIKLVNFSLGSKVHKGDELLAVDATVLKAALEQAKSAYVSAELQYNITKKLFDGGNASEAELRNVEVQKSAAAAAVESTQKSFNDTRIKAPISGFIATKDNSITVGNFLAAGVPVTKIIDINTLKATVLVAENDVVYIKKGISADVYVSALKKTFTGKVNAIAPGNDRRNNAFPVEITWKNTSNLAVKSGMSVKININIHQKDSVMLAPLQAVIEKEEQKAVFIDDAGKAVIRFVVPGRTVGSKLEIIEGLNVGELLVVSGMTTLVQGDKIISTVIDQNVGGN